MIADDAFEELPEHEPAWAVLDRVTAYRKQLLAAGYSPVPVNGKNITARRLAKHPGDDAIIDTWAITRADHLNTGVLCRDTPFIDIDVTVEEVAEEIEALLESEIENSAVRIGLPPKRAIPFRTDAPFKKIATQFKDPNGQIHKVEVLGDGQQIVVNGIHPDTHKPYRWHGGEPGPKLRREDLPLITAETAAAFIAAAAEVMRAHGWEEIGNRKIEWRRRHHRRQYRRQRARLLANAPMRRPRSTDAPRSWPTPRPAIAITSFTKNHSAVGTMVGARLDCARGGRGRAVRCGRGLRTCRRRWRAADAAHDSVRAGRRRQRPASGFAGPGRAAG